MTTKALSERLASLCTEPRAEAAAGRILVPERPVDLVAELTRLLDEDGSQPADDLLWNGFADTVIRWWGPDVWRPAVRFAWAGGAAPGVRAEGPVPWDGGLHVVRLEGLEFVALPIDEWGNPERVVARLEPRASGELVGAFLADAAPSNGRDYGFELFGSLPSATVDHAGIPDPLLEDAFHRWVDRHQEAMPWLELRDWLLETAREPDPLTRGLRMIREPLSEEHTRFIIGAYVARSCARP